MVVMIALFCCITWDFAMMISLGMWESKNKLFLQIRQIEKECMINENPCHRCRWPVRP